MFKKHVQKHSLKTFLIGIVFLAPMVMGLGYSLPHVSADTSPSLDLELKNTTETSATFNVKITGYITTIEPISFRVKYGLTESNLNKSTTWCEFDPNNPGFDANGQKICVLTATALTPRKTYYYKLDSDAQISHPKPSYSGSFVAQNQTTSTGSAAPALVSLTTSHTTGTFTANYRFDGAITSPVQFYARLVDLGTDPAATIAYDVPIITIQPPNNPSATFDVIFNFGILHLQTERKYMYTIVDAKVSETAHYLQFGCFTISNGSVSCDANSTGSGTTAQTDQQLGGHTGGTNIGNSIYNIFVNSLNPSTTGAAFDLTIGTKDGQPRTTQFFIYTGVADSGGNVSLQSAGSFYNGLIDDATPITFSLTHLLAGTTYSYEFRETSTSTTSTVGSFTTLSSAGGTSGTGGGTPAGAGGAGAPVNDPGNTAGNTSNTSGNATTDFGNAAGGAGGNAAGSGSGNGNLNATGNVNQPAEEEALPENFLKNPLAPGLNSPSKIVAAVINNIILPIAIPFIAIMIMYSGFLFVTARKSGNTNTLDKAKTTFKYTIIGAALMLGAFVIATALQGTFKDLLGSVTTDQSTTTTTTTTP